MFHRFEISGLCCSEAFDADGYRIDRSTAIKFPAVVPVYYHHDKRHRIGEGAITLTNRGLHFIGEIRLDPGNRADADVLHKLSLLRGLSIGYIPSPGEDRPPTTLRAVGIIEVSVCEQFLDPLANSTIRRIP
jgi:hypothetical protein